MFSLVYHLSTLSLWFHGAFYPVTFYHVYSALSSSFYYIKYSIFNMSSYSFPDYWWTCWLSQVLPKITGKTTAEPSTGKIVIRIVCSLRRLLSCFVLESLVSLSAFSARIYWKSINNEQYQLDHPHIHVVLREFPLLRHNSFSLYRIYPGVCILCSYTHYWWQGYGDIK